MSFPVLASDPKSTRILFQDGEESDATVAEMSTAQGEVWPQEFQSI